MGKFLSDWVNGRSRDGVHWTLSEPVTYVGDHGEYTVPADYVSDLASVPWLFRLFFPRSGPWNLAAILHDWLITHGLDRKLVDLTSAQVDREFRGALKVCKVGWLRRWLMWTAVRWAAVGSKVRRAGWLKTLPQLLTATALELAPIVGAIWAALNLM